MRSSCTRVAQAALLLSAAVQCRAQIAKGADLVLAWCSATDVQQQFTVRANSVTTPDGSLCATMSQPYPAALTMQPCVAGEATQAWAYGGASGPVPFAFTAPAGADGACLLLNTQGGPGYEMAGSTVGVYACSTPTPFDSVFTPNYPAPGLLAANMTSPGNRTFSDLCVAAVNPPPPPRGTPQQVAWERSRMACFIHWNMATAVGSQGCGGGNAPPDISNWHPTALNTDAWISAGMAMGCKRFVYVAKHGCGFTTWPSTALVRGVRYPYSIAFAPNTTDVVGAFVASAKKAGTPFGFYYSLGSNAYANAVLKLSGAEFDALVLAQLRELWTAYGPLAEVWMDGGEDGEYEYRAPFPVCAQLPICARAPLHCREALASCASHAHPHSAARLLCVASKGSHRPPCGAAAQYGRLWRRWSVSIPLSLIHI